MWLTKRSENRISHLASISENERGTSTLKPKLQDIAVHNSTALTDDDLRDHTR